jgi:hypothetical protein
MQVGVPEDGGMPIYLVERVLPGATIDTIEAIRCAAQRSCGDFASAGKTVRYLRSTFTPGDSRCRCLFQAPTVDLVQELNDAAQMPYSRIVLAVEFPAEAPRETRSASLVATRDEARKEPQNAQRCMNP